MDPSAGHRWVWKVEIIGFVGMGCDEGNSLSRQLRLHTRMEGDDAAREVDPTDLLEAGAL